MQSMNIGRTIARERRAHGITQEALADHLGVSKAAVSKWELGQSLPDVSLLPRIAAYFSLTLDELFDWRDELTEEESAALYAEVYALGEKDMPAAHERLKTLVADHYSDANLLLMFASLLTVWSDVMSAPHDEAAGGIEGCHIVSAQGGPRDGDVTSERLSEEALVLADRVLDGADDPSVRFLANQQKATTLFQMGRYQDAAALLQPLAKRQDAGTVVMLLVSSYRKLGRTDDALELLQAERMRAANFVLSSLMQETGMRDGAAFAQAAGKAGRAIFDALDMRELNPWFPVSMALEEAEACRRAGERGAAFDALRRAVEALDSVASTAASEALSSSLPSASLLCDHMLERLDPSRFGETWAEHKKRQATETAVLMRRAVAAQVAAPAWQEFAGDDARYRAVVDVAERLVAGEASDAER